MDSYYSEEIKHYFHDETGSHMQESWQNAHNLRAQYLRNNSMEEEKFVAKLSSLSKQQESEGITEIAKIGDKTVSRLERRREQNRKAAAKLRLRKQQKYERLIKNAQNEEDIFVQLQTEVDQLTKIFSENAQILRAHQKQCPFLKITDNSQIYYALQ